MNPTHKGAINRLRQSIQIRTESFEDTLLVDYKKYEDFRSFLTSAFPLVFQNLKVEIINNHSMVFEWNGLSMNSKPILFVAHYDVVPVDSKEVELWSLPPFGGNITDGYIYGRGTLDMKSSLMGILESFELLLKKGHQPKKTIYLAVGHDEETGGLHGAEFIADYFKQRNLQFEFILDEGMIISDGLIPGVKEKLALIGISEKGNATFEILCKSEGGHSSMPIKSNPITILSNFLKKLDGHPQSKNISHPVKLFLKGLSKHSKGLKKKVLQHPDWFSGIISKEFNRTPSGFALMNNCHTPTVLNAGVNDNCIPTQASVKINCRILPGYSIDDIKLFLTEMKKENIEIKLCENWKTEPMPVSSVQNKAFEVIVDSVKEVFDIDSIPGLAIGTTDSRHYRDLTQNIYRFLPIVLNGENLKGIHGINEKISVDGYLKMIDYYTILIQKFDQ